MLHQGIHSKCCCSQREQEVQPLEETLRQVPEQLLLNIKALRETNSCRFLILLQVLISCSSSISFTLMAPLFRVKGKEFCLQELLIRSLRQLAHCRLTLSTNPQPSQSLRGPVYGSRNGLITHPSMALDISYQTMLQVYSSTIQQK